MIIAQITDMHVRPVGRVAYERVDTNAMLADTIAAIMALDRRPDMVIATGDLTDCGLEEEYELLQEILEDAGYRALSAASGREGVALAASTRPAVIVLDLIMEGMDGFQAAADFDSNVVDGAVNGVAGLVRGGGRGLRVLQTGYVRSYALGVSVGVVVLLGYFLTRVSF